MKNMYSSMPLLYRYHTSFNVRAFRYEIYISCFLVLITELLHQSFILAWLKQSFTYRL